MIPITTTFQDKQHIKSNQRSADRGRHDPFHEDRMHDLDIGHSLDNIDMQL
jgi:hypothetical protein